MSIENHPLWKGICMECVGGGCGPCFGTGMRHLNYETEHLTRVPKKPVGLATEIEGKTVRVVRPGSVA